MMVLEDEARMPLRTRAPDAVDEPQAALAESV
jgi:hypothetical protein